MSADKDARIAELVVWRRKENMGEYVDYVYYATNCWPDLEPLYLQPANRIAEPKSPNYVIELMPPNALIAHAIALQKERAELERKLAEQHAILAYLMDRFDNESWECQCGNSEETSTMDSAIFLREYLKENSSEELNKLISKAKEEGRKEAVQECAALCDRFAVREMHPKECADAIRMLAAAPKPQGETSCQ